MTSDQITRLVTPLLRSALADAGVVDPAELEQLTAEARAAVIVALDGQISLSTHHGRVPLESIDAWLADRKPADASRAYAELAKQIAATSARANRATSTKRR
jgi:hypothetical protein